MHRFGTTRYKKNWALATPPFSGNDVFPKDDEDDNNIDHDDDEDGNDDDDDENLERWLCPSAKWVKKGGQDQVRPPK